MQIEEQQFPIFPLLTPSKGGGQVGREQVGGGGVGVGGQGVGDGGWGVGSGVGVGVTGEQLSELT